MSAGTITLVSTPPSSKSYTMFGSELDRLYPLPIALAPMAAPSTTVRSRPVIRLTRLPTAMIALLRTTEGCSPVASVIRSPAASIAAVSTPAAASTSVTGPNTIVVSAAFGGMNATVGSADPDTIPPPGGTIPPGGTVGPAGGSTTVGSLDVTRARPVPVGPVPAAPSMGTVGPASARPPMGMVGPNGMVGSAVPPGTRGESGPVDGAACPTGWGAPCGAARPI